MMGYAWTIDAEHGQHGAVGAVGPLDETRSDGCVMALWQGHGLRFKLLTGDGTVRYEGRMMIDEDVLDALGKLPDDEFEPAMVLMMSAPLADCPDDEVTGVGWVDQSCPICEAG